MDDKEYIKNVAAMLYCHQVHCVLANIDSEYLNILPKIAQGKKFSKIYKIFSRDSVAKSAPKILETIKSQLGVVHGEDLNFLNKLTKEQILVWFAERHEKYKEIYCGTYWIHCIPTLDTYLGSSINVPQRLKSHKYLLDNSRHPNAKLQRLWNIHGEANFELKMQKCTVDYKSHERTLIRKLKPYLPLLNCQQKSCYARCQRNVLE